MEKCPVCEARLEGMVCACGYDESRDYGLYPTLGRLTDGVESVAAMRVRQQDLLCCVECGGYQFRMSRSRCALTCTRCGKDLPEELWKPLVAPQGEKKKRKKAEAKPQNPKRIVSVALGNDHTVALYADGTVRAIGGNGKGQCDVEDWREIVFIAAGYNRTLGVKKDGTVVAAGAKSGGMKETAKWKDIAQVVIQTDCVIGLKKDGTVIGNMNVYGWREITAVAASSTHSVGLRTNGALVTAGTGAGVKLPWFGWKNFAAVAVGRDFTVGLKKDGTVLAVGDRYKKVETWREITAIAAAGSHVIGLKKNGTAVVVGYDAGDWDRVSKWKELTAVFTGTRHTVGLKKDGSLIAAGANNKGQCDVEKLIATEK